VVWTGGEYLEARETGGREVKAFDLERGGIRSVVPVPSGAS